MSGGVDSSVAAALLLQQGYEVIGVFMRLGSPEGVEAPDDPEDPATDGRRFAGNTGDQRNVDDRGGDERGAGDHSANDVAGNRAAAAARHAANHAAAPKHKQGCCSVLDAADARRVAGMLDIPFYVLNFEQDFGRVIDYFVSEYNRGRTPNPCVRCNDWLKFGRLAKYAQAVGADYVASGHYARIGVDPANGQPALMRGLDVKKDQSYVLFGMTRDALAHTLLPIGGYEKHEVRRLAEQWKLPVFNKPDSQEICFVPNQDYAALVQRRTPDKFAEGELVSVDGQTLGAHAGHQHFTIGQRKGVRLALGHPIYVVDIDPQNNRVTLGDKEHLLKQTLIARQINLTSTRLADAIAGVDHARFGGTAGEPAATDPMHSASSIATRSTAMLVGAVRCSAKIRYNASPRPAIARLTGPDEITVVFDEPQAAITPGQAVVLYDNDVVLGGGWIEAAFAART